MKKFNRILVIALILILSLSSGVFAQNSELPEKYDLRNVNGKNYVTDVKFQNPWGTCWSFAATSVAETSALLKGAPEDIDLSERSLAWFNSRMQKNLGAPDKTYEGYYTLSSEGAPSGVGFETWAAFNNGGFQWFSVNQFASWNATSREATAPYINDEGLMDNGIPSEHGDWSLPQNQLYDRQVHLQNGEVRYTISDQDAEGNKIYNTQPEITIPEMKQAILDHGAIIIDYGANQDRFYGKTFFNSETSAYYNYNAALQQPDHSVTVVGWDDTYPASNFSTTPPGDGAFIVKNSWSTKFGDEGYFYLSYYDQSIELYTWMDVETADTDSGFTYDNIYQYDLLGAKNGDLYSHMFDIMANSGYNAGDLKYASIFKADHNETLQAVSVFNPNLDSENFDISTKTDIEVYLLNNNYTSPTDGELVATGSITTNNYGFHTVTLNTPVQLTGGASFSVVETAVSTVLTTENTIFEAPMIAVEYGLELPNEYDLQGPDGAKTGEFIAEIRARAEAGQSFIYGLNGDSWDDVTSEAVTGNERINTTVNGELYGEAIQNRTEIGNALIKAYTTDNETVPPTPEKPEVEKINLTPFENYLTTIPGEGNTNSVTISASFEPEGAYLDVDNLVWSATPEVLDMQVDPSNLSVTVTAKEEGYGAVECFNGAQIGVAVFQVSNEPLIADSIDITNSSPDSFNITVSNVQSNPAFATKTEAENVLLFSWSESNQADINAKVVQRQDGSNDFVLENVPVNDTPENNYFIDADSIKINAYATSGDNTIWLGSTGTSWIDGKKLSPNDIENGTEDMMTYIAYGQNIGFVRPAVFNGSTSGVIGDSNSKHLEGVRISCNVTGMSVNTSVYSEGIGWIEGGDGQYVGTMWQNRPISALKINCTGNYVHEMGGPINYRAYIDGQGWTDWVTNDTTVGIPNSGQPILAIEITIPQVE